jgi:hypothetical protein
MRLLTASGMPVAADFSNQGIAAARSAFTAGTPN